MHFSVEKGEEGKKTKNTSVLRELETDGRVTLSEPRTAESLIFILWVFLKKWSAAEAMRRQGYGAYEDLASEKEIYLPSAKVMHAEWNINDDK